MGRKDTYQTFIINVIDKPEWSTGQEDFVANKDEGLAKENIRDTLKNYMDKVEKDPDLNKEFEKFEEWLANKIDRVWIASRCLKAYSDLFNYELAILYKN